LKNLRKQIKQLRNQKGIALLLAVGVVTVLTTTTIELNRRTRDRVVTVATTRDRYIVTEMATSGIHTAMAILIKDKLAEDQNPVDSVQEDWADPEKVAEIIQEVIPLEKGEIKVTISDELSRLQVNALVDYFGRNDAGSQKHQDKQVGVWESFLDLTLAQYEESEEFEDLEPLAVIASIIDWVDWGDDDSVRELVNNLSGAQGMGAEADFYESLDPPYAPRNSPMVHIGELAQVKDMTPEIFYGGQELAGIAKYVSVHGLEESADGFAFPGKININTADVSVLAAMAATFEGWGIEDGQDCAAAMDEYRKESVEGEFVNQTLHTPMWYQGVPGCEGLNISEELVRVASDLYRIESTAKNNDTTATVIAVVERKQNTETGKWYCRIISWET
jgi:general secretion pathway protein K